MGQFSQSFIDSLNVSEEEYQRQQQESDAAWRAEYDELMAGLRPGQTVTLKLFHSKWIMGFVKPYGDGWFQTKVFFNPGDRVKLIENPLVFYDWIVEHEDGRRLYVNARYFDKETIK
jgi:hypothetical protein